MWFVIFGVTILASIIGIVYLINALSRFSLISRLKFKRLFSALILILSFLGFAVLLGFVNAITILIYVTAFFLLSGLIIRLIQKKSDKKSTVYWQGWIALSVSFIYLSCAYFLCHNIWKTEYNLTSEKNISGLRIAMIADSHLGTTFDGEKFAEELKKIEACNPDMLIISGDYVDNDSRKKDMVRACEALGDMNLKYGVFFAYGNHDKHTFNGRDFTVEDLENEFKKNNVNILEDEIINVENLCIVGRKDFSTESREDISELLKDVDKNNYIIVIDHEPTDYENESVSSADLVLSGHTHGGQLLAIKYVGELSGVNDKTYGYERINNTDFIVTSGISDWALDFKTGTKSEFVIINVN